MRVHVDMDADEVKTAIAEYVERKTGVAISSRDVVIETKSKQNYKSEWEEAAIRCNFSAKEARDER